MIEIILGERTYTIEELGINDGERWRKLLDEPISEILDAVMAVNSDLGSITDAQSVIPVIHRVLMGSVRMIADLVIAYDGQLETDREYIMQHAKGSQAMDAFVEMLKLAFPFGRALDQILRLSNGLGVAQPLTNSPALNGASGPMKSAQQG